MKEQDYDHFLNIKTCGDQKGFNKSFHYHRYEPTPYSALDILFSTYELKSTDRIVDFGCGKGRLNFYIHHTFAATAIGIEMNETFYHEAIENRNGYLKKMKTGSNKIQFYCCLAEEYEIHPLDNKYYFFNPFSVQVFMSIINNILLSVEQFYREIDLILYYPSEEYVYYLDNQTSFEMIEEVRLPGLYEHNPYEKFLIYRLAY